MDRCGSPKVSTVGIMLDDSAATSTAAFPDGASGVKLTAGTTAELSRFQNPDSKSKDHSGVEASSYLTHQLLQHREQGM
jgi:hypothetical protein